MKFTVYPSSQLKLAAAREDRRACVIAVAACAVSAVLLAMVLGKCEDLVLRAVLAGDVVMCAAVAVFYAVYAVILGRRIARLKGEVSHE